MPSVKKDSKLSADNTNEKPDSSKDQNLKESSHTSKDSVSSSKHKCKNKEKRKHSPTATCGEMLSSEDDVVVSMSSSSFKEKMESRASSNRGTAQQEVVMKVLGIYV